MGINRAGIYFDYAYHRYGNVAENTTHFFSVSFKLGELKPDKAKEAVKTEIPPPVPVIIPGPVPVIEEIAPPLKGNKPGKGKGKSKAPLKRKAPPRHKR